MNHTNHYTIMERQEVKGVLPRVRAMVGEAFDGGAYLHLSSEGLNAMMKFSPESLRALAAQMNEAADEVDARSKQAAA